MIDFDKIPLQLRERPQWVLWKDIERDGQPTKVPFQVNGKPAKTSDPNTWSTFALVRDTYFATGQDAGVGFVFADTDHFCGIDLNGCRDPDTGIIAEWAASIIRDFGTYAEISPSQTGVKLFCIGVLPVRTGKNIKLPQFQNENIDKVPGVEMYDHGRYFAVTGMRLDDNRAEPEERQPHVNALFNRYWPAVSVAPASEFFAPQSIIDRARQYLQKCPPAISGQGGHKATFRTACLLVKGFVLDSDQALVLLQEWNQTCQPPWTERELIHKIDGAKKTSGKIGYLRNTKPEKWASVDVPDYENALQPPKDTGCIQDAARAFIERRKRKGTEFIRTGLPSIDSALGGGLEAGEFVIIAARPSHGKSAVALQCAHNMTGDGLPVLFISEEMSRISLGKRLLLYASTVPQDDWDTSMADVEADLAAYGENRAKCHVIESCSTAMRAVAEIERAVEELGVKVAIIDYAQLLGSKGNGRYEEITNVSMSLRRVATEKNILVIALCQLNRQLENELLKEPKNHFLRDSGQLEQDADVIMFTVRRHLLDKHEDPKDFRFYITKNRNRETLQREVQLTFDASRQTVLPKH